MKRLFGPLLSSILILAADVPAHADTITAERYLDALVDRSVDPGDDFFRYAVGKWLAAHPIPPSESSWGIGKTVQEETYRRLIAINEEATRAAATAAPGSNAQKIGDFWHAAMDTATIEKLGMTPLAGYFQRIADIRTKEAFIDEVGRLQYIGVGAMCGTFIFQDEKNSERMAVHLYQGGLGLPDRAYYFDDDERTRTIREEYVKHVGRMFELLGDASNVAQKNAATVMALETELAGASRKLEDLRDSNKNYNEYAVRDLAKLAPSVRWREFLEQGGIVRVDTVIVGQPEFFEQLEKSLKTRGLDEWKTYLRWQLATTFAAPAGGKFDVENFRFYGTVLSGAKVQRPRWKRMLDAEENYLGDALGQLYVERHFSPASKARYEKLTDEIFQAFRERIRGLAWMSDATKTRALRKLDSVTKKIGYPNRWRDYSAFEVNRDSHLLNCLRGNVWASDYTIAKLGKPVDRTEWQMTPQTYNAYYNPSSNEIVMPAAIFVLPGIDDAEVDDALAYGYAGGTTIGHEITHGFDDDGRQFDERGNLESWWTEADEAEFKRRAEVIVQQYDAYIAVDSLRVNGKATAGENIADLGGIVLGWEAFKKTEQYRSGKVIGGYTPAQRYFIGWALGWMNELRPENLALRVKSDVHAPSFLRVIGPVTNHPAYYEAFGVKPGQPMYREPKVRGEIW
jgi:putative endopeptidase